jgi:hypothetical protein
MGITVGLVVLLFASGGHVTTEHQYKEYVAQTVAYCAESLCDPASIPETRILFSWTAKDATVVQVCSQHRAFTHTWRTAFCTAHMPAVTAPDYGDAAGGIADRSRHALGLSLIGSGVWPS